LHPVERKFALPAFDLAALEWGVGGSHRIIALHGWLDNAGSFELLAPHLEDCHLLALDCAGHGYSGFRSADAGYSIWQDVRDVLAVADQLGWRTFSLLGHSRGAAIATLTAGSFADRIERLILIEGGVPVVGHPAKAPQELAKSIADNARLQGRVGGRIFESRDIAIQERCAGFTAVTEEAAMILAKRSLRAVPGGYQWQVDQRLKAASEVRLTLDQIQGFIDATSAPVLALLAEVSPFSNRPEYRALLERFRDVRIERLAGGHHFHLEGAQHEIAQRIRRFMGRQQHA
jgi:pimeloyl-ACP methyl ester carboxylesterase